MERIPLSFSVELYGSITPTINPNVNKTRLRTFYKYENRNGSYIDDKVAQYMIDHAAGTPVVGSFNETNGDFRGHVKDLRTAKTYGCIPFPTNFAWEKHNDEDGIEREYACFDIWVFGYHPEAAMIPGKKHSMELDKRTIGGQWTEDYGRRLFRYNEGVVLFGLCVLGNAQEPCFEGSSFFAQDDFETDEQREAYENFVFLAKTIIQTAFMSVQSIPQGGETKMPVINIAGVEHQNYEAAFTAINPGYNAEGSFGINEVIFAMSDDTFSAFDCENKKTKNYKYSVGDEGIQFELASETDCLNDEHCNYEELKNKVEEVNGLYEAVKAEYEALKTTNETTAQELSEQKNSFESLKSEYDTLKETTISLEEYNTVKTQLDSANSTIEEYKKKDKDFELDRKKELLASYENQIPEENYSVFSETLDSFTYETLEAKLAIVYSNFVRNNGQNRIPTPNFNKEEGKTKAQEILEKYRRK